MSGFKPYPAYKDSGVEWLGDVPESWTVTLLKRGYEVVLGKMLQPEAKRENDELLPYLRAANIQPSGIDVTDVKNMWFGAEEKKSLILRRGDLLVSEGGDVGRSAVWDLEGEYYFQNSINRIRSIAGNDTRFLYFWMTDIKSKGYVDVLCNKSTIAHFTAEKVAAVPLLIPSKNEQTQIARFLDHETARIDALIEEQQRLIELLKEKRQAVISHAVTKGLDPTVPMKDSGVEWLGEVPEGWILARGDAYLRSQAKVVSADYLGGKEVFHYSIPAVQATGDGQLEDGDEIDSSKLLVEQPQVLISKLNPRKNTVCLAGPREVVTVCSGEFVPLQSDCMDLKWVYYLVSSENFKKRLESLVESATRSHQRVNPSDILKFRGAFPLLAEQTQIARFLDHETARIDALIEEAMGGVVFLQERRSALISAAVTGKIDVRNWQLPASAQAPKLEEAEVV